MADIVARLKLDNKDYEQKLAKAKKSTKSFAQDGGAGLSDMMGKFTALAGAVAGCKAVMDTFNAVINSSQTYADTYANAIASVKGVVDNVVYSLANADFSSFERGLRGVAEASWAASAALDQLWNTKQSASYFTAKNREKLAELLNVAKDESKTAEQRKQAQAMIDAVIKDQKEVVAVTRQDVDKAIYAMINDAAGGRLTEGQVNQALIEETLRIDVSLDRDKLKADIERQYEEYRRLSAKISDQYMEKRITYGFGGVQNVEYLGVSDEGKQKLAQLDAQYADIIVKRSTLEVMTDKELQHLIEELNYAIQQERMMEKIVAQRVAINNQLAKQLPVEQKITAEYQKRELKMAGLPEGTDSAPLPDKIEMPTAATSNIEAMTEQTYTATDALGALGSAMGNLSGLVDEGAAGWLNYGANILSAVAKAIPAITALTAAKSTEATANTASAASGAASSVASIPVVGPIMAVAAVASVLAALANLPKFATGGIVPGTSWTGDNVLIRANSGERVLTREQNAAYERGMGLGGKVVFEIKGDRLVGILNNQNKLTAQNYG